MTRLREKYGIRYEREPRPAAQPANDAAAAQLPLFEAAGD